MKTASLKAPAHKRQKKRNGLAKSTASSKSATDLKKKGPGQGKGGGRLLGSKVTQSPTSKRIKVLPPAGSDAPLSKRRLMQGATLTPASDITEKSDEVSAARYRSLSEDKGIHRRLRALEKAVVSHVTQLRDLVRAREGEYETVQSLLQSTPMKDIKLHRAQDVPEPDWFKQVKDRLAEEETAALTGATSFNVDDF